MHEHWSSSDLPNKYPVTDEEQVKAAEPIKELSLLLCNLKTYHLLIQWSLTDMPSICDLVRAFLALETCMIGFDYDEIGLQLDK
ncbi:hypothetical protein BGX24_004690, partial [Mortierella sp. AD032]